MLVGPLIIDLDAASVCWSCNHSLPLFSFTVAILSSSLLEGSRSMELNTSVNSVYVLHKTGGEHLFWTAHCDDLMIFVHRVLLVRIFEQAAINQRCKGYCSKTLKICFYHSRLRRLFSQRYHLCWAENISDRVPCKLFVLDRAPQINNFFLTDIDAELGAENH